MVQFVVFPGIDDQYFFPEEVRQAIANSPELVAAFGSNLRIKSTPPDPAVSPAYIDSSTVPPTLKGWDGSDWVAIGSPTTTIVNTTLPSISGYLTVGSLLTANVGSWSPTPDYYVFRWKRGGVNISGATSATYTTTSSDSGQAISVEVVAVKVGFASDTEISNYVTITPVTDTQSLLTESGDTLILESGDLLLVG